jgi:hypothetical protein
LLHFVVAKVSGSAFAIYRCEGRLYGVQFADFFPIRNCFARRFQPAQLLARSQRTDLGADNGIGVARLSHTVV